MHQNIRDAADVDDIHEQYSLFKAVMDGAVDGFFVKDCDGRYLLINAAGARMRGLAVADIIGRTDADLACPTAQSAVTQQQGQRTNSGAITTSETSTTTPDGIAHTYLTTLTPRCDASGRILGCIGVCRDITEQRHVEVELAQALSLTCATLESTADGILVVDADGRATSWNRKFIELWRSPDQLFISGDAQPIAAAVLERLSDPAAFVAKIEALRSEPLADSLDTLESTDGRVYERYSTPHRMGTKVVGRVWSFRDVTAQHRLQGELTRRALHDELTGLANRALYGDRVAHALQQPGNKGSVAVLILDLDDFKAVNDGLGHITGDRLLIAVADRLRRCTRAGDTIARLGGDEFAVLLEGASTEDEAITRAENIITALREPVWLDGREIAPAASIGVMYGGANETVETMLRNSDLAMYIAKRNGKGRVVCYEKAMHAEAVERLALEADLRHAIDRNEFSLVYQPIVNLDTGQIAGAEALLRWRHPSRGLVSPATFIPIAEETGLIVTIGRWALREACRQGAAWHRRTFAEGVAIGTDQLLAVPTISVNVSGRQLQDAQLIPDIAAALSESGLPPSHLVIELTESVVMRDAQTVLATLEALKALNVRVAIDDFGTGYSSLSYLQRFPMDVLKIDKTFVEGVARGGSDAALARTILALGKTLGLQCVAEGVETPEQQNALQALGCPYGQGYLFAHPVLIDAFTAVELLPVPRTPYLGVLREIGGVDELETEIYQGVQAGSGSTCHPARCHDSTGSSRFGAKSKRAPEVGSGAVGRSGACLPG